jgi:hypothetical protein
MESLKPLIWEKGNDKNTQATWYGLIEGDTGKLLMFSVRPASNDKKTGYYRNCMFASLLKLPMDSTMYDSVEDARVVCEQAFIDMVSVFHDRDSAVHVGAPIIAPRAEKIKVAETTLF